MPYVHSHLQDILWVAADERAGRYSHSPANFLYATAASGAPDWLTEYLPDSAEVTAGSNWLVPVFQSIFSPPA